MGDLFYIFLNIFSEFMPLFFTIMHSLDLQPPGKYSCNTGQAAQA